MLIGVAVGDVIDAIDEEIGRKRKVYQKDPKPSLLAKVSEMAQGCGIADEPWSDQIVPKPGPTDAQEGLSQRNAVHRSDRVR